MGSWPSGISAITLFVEDLAATKQFYREVFGLPVPIVVGLGNPALPSDIRIPLHLVDERRFGNGVVYVRYRID